MNAEALTQILLGPSGLGVRFERESWEIEYGLDCRSCAYLVLRDVFGLPVEREDFAMPEDLGSRAELEVALERRAARWTKLGESAECAREPGDVLLSAPDPSEGLVHLSVIVAANPHRAITCTDPDGVSMPRVFLIRGVFAAYRFAGASA